MVDPPVADQDPGVVNPFLNSLSVNLSGPLGTTVYYDINNPAPFDPASAEAFVPGTPILLSSTSILRAVSVQTQGMSTFASDVATWQYDRDAYPVVTMTAPENGAAFQPGESVTFTSSISDADGPAPIGVKYFSADAGGSTWSDLGDGGAAPDYSLVVPIPAGTTTGTRTIRAIATDGRGAADTAEITIDIVAPENHAPVADAGADVNLVLPAASVQLDGTGSSDPDDPGGATLQYQWSGTGVIFTGGGTAKPTAQFAEPGIYTVTLKVTDQGSPALSATDQVVVRVYAKPSITSPLSKSGTAGAAFTYTPAASGYPAPVLSASGLPDWLTFDPGTGILSGTPVAAGEFNATLGATNAAGSDSRTLTISIGPPLSKPVITSPLTASGPAGAPFSYTLKAAGNPTPELGTEGVLPTWLSFNSGNGVLSGTPPAQGAFQISLTAKNSQGTDNQTLALTIGAPLAIPAITSPLAASGTALTAFSYTLTATGNPPPNLSIGAEGPAWLEFDASTGKLTGTPPVQGSFTVGLMASNTQGADRKTLAITIAPALTVPVITSSATASGTAKVPFSYTLSATGNPTPTLAATGMPAWLFFNPGNGVLSGTPTAKGSFSILLTATNNQGSDGKTLTLSISDSTVKPTITSAAGVTTKTGVTFSYTITATGTSPIAFSTSTLPPGLNRSGPLISGSPTATGIYPVTLTATNAYGNNQKTLTITVDSDPRITTDLDTLLTVFDKSRAAFSVTASGFPAVSYQWQYAAAPGGPFNNTGSNSAGYIIDPVSPAAAGYYRVMVRNGAGPVAASRLCHLVVKPLPAPIRITLQPASAIVATVGQKVRMVGKATGEPKLLYQWFKGNAAATPAPKQDDSVFTIAAAVVGDAGNYRVKVTNSYTDNADPDTYAYSEYAALTVQEPKLPKPYAKPAGGAFYPEVKLVLANDTPGTAIYFTFNGADPVPTSTRFNPGDTIRLTATGTVRARSYKTGFQASDVLAETYTYTVPGKVVKPVIKPTAPTFKNSLVCSLSTTTPDARIFYTLDGSNPATGNPIEFKAPFTLTATTTVLAIARKTGMLDSDTLRMAYTLEVNPSKIITPTLSPSGGDFTGQVKAVLSDPADTLAALWYTLDGSSPEISGTRKLYAGAPIPITASTTVKAVAIRSGFLNSDVVVESYRLVPGPIVANPPPSVFEGGITVKLSAVPAGAQIRYLLDGSPTPESPLFPVAGLDLNSTTTLSAIAILDGISSPVYSFGYTLAGGQLATPAMATTGNQNTFRDTLRIGLSPPVPGAEIYFTRNGGIPTVRSERYTGPILIDTTTTLQVIAVKAGFENSKILVATYTLVPEAPTVSPPGGSYPNAVFARLSSPSRRATLYYTLDGTDPMPGAQLRYHPGDSIPISVNTTLKAVAVAGNLASPVREETYEIIGVVDYPLRPGVTTPIPGGYILRIPEDEVARVQARIAGTKLLNLAGFESVQYGLTLSLDASEAYTGNEFPRVTLAGPSTDKRSLYKVEPSGLVYFVSSADTVTLTQAGTYFKGIDIAPPVITYLAESFTVGDSTRAAFHITDNVANLSYDVNRNDNAAKGVSRRSIFSGSDLAVKLKHPLGTLKPLYVQVVVNDYQQAAFFPPEAGTMLSVSQRIGALTGPPLWGIGTSGSPYDLVGIPLALDPPVTLETLRAANPGANLEGAAWSNADSAYHPLDADVTLQPGQSYWLGSRTRISAFTRADATTLPTGTGYFSVVLHHGWNQIANPHLEELYWPYARGLGQTAYRSFPIKGLWEYSPASVGYAESDTLKPWRGYYVYNYLGDTTVNLSPRPVSMPAMKKTVASDRIDMSLGWGTASVMRLGADRESSDGLGVEDEFSLPMRNGGHYMRALRKGWSLASDYVRLDGGGIQEWKVAIGGEGDSLPPLKILSQSLPAGYETWAVSPSRNMRFKVETGSEIQASGLARDTLVFYSGPHEKMAAFRNLQNLPVAAAPLDLRVAVRNGGFRMRMTLPSKARFHATLWGLDGSRKGELALGPLSEGFYAFDWDSDFRNGNRPLPPGMYILSLEVRGTGLNARLTRKIALSN